MAKLDWLMELMHTKEEWKFVSIVTGLQSALIPGDVQMLKLCAVNLDITMEQVRNIKVFTFISNVLPALAYKGAYFGQGEGPIYLSTLTCAGSENNLLQCGHTGSTGHCDHSLDAGVRCIPGGKDRDKL